MYNFSGRVAVVTGGGDVGDHTEAGMGIGATICAVLAAGGGSIAVVDRDLGYARTTVAGIEALGGVAQAIRADVGDENDCRAAVAEVISEFGRLDVLVTSVGIESYPRTSDDGAMLPPLVPEIRVEDWDRTLRVNLTGVMLMAKHCAPHFSCGSSIVTIASLGALTPARATAAYAASKGAVLTLTRSLAVDLAPTRANCVSPGRVWTPIAKRKIPRDTTDLLRRQRATESLVGIEGTALDIANATAFLASDEARWINGQHLVVDGGARLRVGVTGGRSSGWQPEAESEFAPS